MGIAEKLASAKKSSWVAEGISKAEVKTIVELAKISARIERCRLDMGMTQLEFAEYMGVSQGMVSKWESREYNFTIRSLNEICEKLNLEFSVNIEKPCVKADYTVIRWDANRVIKGRRENSWIKHLTKEEAIA